MKRHELDAISVFFGVLFVAVGATFMFTEVEITDLNWDWGVPVMALAAGLFFLLAAVRRTNPNEESDR